MQNVRLGNRAASKGGEELCALFICLYVKFEHQIRGSALRRWGYNGADEVVWLIWGLIWDKLCQFDPRKEAAAFVFFWAGIGHRRYLSEKRRQNSLVPLEHLLESSESGDRHSEGPKAHLPDALRCRPEYRDPAVSELLLGLMFKALLAPHQILTFVLLEVLGWNPRELLELRDLPLRELFREVESQLLDLFGEAMVRRAVERFRTIMDSKTKLGELSLPPRTRECWARLLDARVCETTLDDYLRGKQNWSANKLSQMLTNWAETVRRHIKAKLTEHPASKCELLGH